MRKLHLVILVLVFGLILASCNNSSDDESGTTGGSGDTGAAASTEAAATSTTTNSSKIWLDAFSDFNCTGNWTNRDGALGLKPYSGSGSCSATFPGTSGTYRMVLKIQTEYDGRSPYRVSINGQTIKEGEYPLSSSLGCDCPHDKWREVCPDRNKDIDLGTRSLSTGDTIGFWGSDVYPCGDHGSYAKWHGITFTKVD